MVESGNRDFLWIVWMALGLGIAGLAIVENSVPTGLLGCTLLATNLLSASIEGNWRYLGLYKD